jgi:replication-associated recombination protein RarA
MRRLDEVAHLVDAGPDPRLVRRRHVLHALEQLGDGALLAEVLDLEVAQRGLVGGPSGRRLRLSQQSIQLVEHRAPSL